MSEHIESSVLSGLSQEGLVLEEKTRFQGELIRACRLKNASLSAPIFDDCLLEDCSFEKTDFSEVRFFHKSTVRNCQFHSVDLRNSGLNDSLFNDCTFVKCDFRKTYFNDCTFINCTFENCKIIDNTFTVANVRDCKFSGKLQDVNFVAEQPNTLLRADFEKCVFDFVSFKNCNIEQIVPPADKQHIYFKDLAERARKALTFVLAQPESPTTKLLKRRLNHYAMQRGGVFNLKNLAEAEGKEFAEQLIGLLMPPDGEAP